MAVLHLRDLSALGVIADVDPYNIPTNAFSYGVNVRFDDGSVERGVVFRNIDTIGSEPRFVVSYDGDSGTEELFIGYLGGEISNWTAGTETDYSITAYTPSDADTPYTAAQLGGLVYINREDRVPWFWAPTETDLQALTNWNSNWRCKILRAYNDCLVAFGMTEGGTALPTKIRTSNIAQFGAVPDSWDETDLTKNATANTLAELKGDIVDAQTLGPSMIIYTKQETWLMQADGSDDIYSYRRLFNDAGAMNANCTVELEGKHYVFGYKDIWVHDGVGKESICNSRVRKRVFTNLDFSVAHYCHVLDNPVLNELYFCYRDGAAEDEYFSSVVGCNRAAVYNYKNNTWSFTTLPNTFSGTQIVIGNAVAYEDTASTYDELSVSYFNLSEESKRAPVMVGEADTSFSLSDRLYGVDMDGDESIIPFDKDTNATLNWILVKEGADLDELDLDLRGYKNIVAVYPQARLADNEMTIEFAFGSGDMFGGTPTYEAYQTYDTTQYYKIDYKSGGRYLAMKARGTNGGRKYFRLSGLDFDVEITGER